MNDVDTSKYILILQRGENIEAREARSFESFWMLDINKQR